MTKIVVDQFQPDCVPQPPPRPREHPIYEPSPKLRKHCLNCLSYTAMKFPLLSHINSRDQQHLGLFSKQASNLRPTVTQIAQRYSSIYCLSQLKGRVSVIEVCRSQYGIYNQSCCIAQSMQLKAEESPRTAFAKVCSVFPQQSDTPVTNWLAYGDRLGVKLVKLDRGIEPRRFKQSANYWVKPVKSANELLVRAKPRKCRGIVFSNKRVGLLQGINSQAILHECNRNDFGIGENRLVVGRRAPAIKFAMSFKEIRDKDIDFSHLIYNSSQRGRPPGARISVSQLNSIHLRTQTTHLFNSILEFS